MKQNPEQLGGVPIGEPPESLASNQTLRSFGVILLLLEIPVIIIYGIFVRMDTHPNTDALQSQRYGAFQDVNVMILIGFGFLMSFIRRHAWSALVYTFFLNAVVIQIYILFNAFWERVFHGFAEQGTFVYLEQIVLIKCAYAVAAVLISYGAVLGRIGPRQLLVMGVIETFGYSLNEVIVYEYIGSFDDGGSMTIHSFGAYFGLTVSLFLSSKVFPISNHTSDYVSNIFTMIGTIFLWLFWPSFNFGVASQTFFEQNQVVVNTLLALIGSCLSTIICSSLLSHGINMEDILNATLAGGVAIGASCGLLYHPGVALAVGFIAGVLSTLGFKYLSPKLLQKFRLHDNCGVNNLHGIPGIFGGVMSAIIVAFYHTGYDQTVAANYGANSIFHRDIGSFLHQGGLQIAGTAASIGMGIFFGIVAGMIVRSIYNEDPNSFYKDNTYFENAEGASSIDSRKELLRQAMEKEKLQTLPNSEQIDGALKREQFSKTDNVLNQPSLRANMIRSVDKLETEQRMAHILVQ